MLIIPSVVLVGVLVFWSTRAREPQYGGKKLSEWVVKCAPPAGASISGNFVLLSNPPPAAYRVVSMLSIVPTESEKALRNIGTNALPYLLKWFRYEPPAWKRKLLPVIYKTFHRALPDYEQIRADGAVTALIGLGSAAEGAVPSLARMMNDANSPARASRATAVLSVLQSTVFTAAMALMTNSSHSVRLNAINALARSGSPLGPAVPLLLQCLDDPDTETAMAAAEMLGIGRAEPGVAVPALVKSLQDKRLLVRKAALSALGAFHHEARAAIPPIAVMLEDPDYRLRFSAAHALEDIDPRAFEKLIDR